MREVEYFFVQSSTDNGYLLFPHQDLPQDSLHLPPYCLRDGHPTKVPEQWSVLSDYSDSFQTGDRVLMYQSGKPQWLSGFWGYGTIQKRQGVVKVASDRVLSTPLILDRPTRGAITAPFLKLLTRARRKRGSSYRKTYARISEAEFQAFVRLMESREKVVPRRARARDLESIAKKRAAEAFRKWALDNGWTLLGPAGYPDILAKFPNGRIAAFEGKFYPDEELRETQMRMFPLLRRIGLSITTLRNVRNEEIQGQILRSHWKVISQGDGRTTRGWPDFMMERGRRVVAVELKTGKREPLSPMQVETLSALASQIGIEVHVARAIREGNVWELYDDTERWLLYPSVIPV